MRQVHLDELSAGSFERSHGLVHAGRDTRLHAWSEVLPRQAQTNTRERRGSRIVVIGERGRIVGRGRGRRGRVTGIVTGDRAEQ